MRALGPIAALLWLLPTFATALADEIFHITNQLSPGEISELTTVSIDEHVMGSFQLNRIRPSMIIEGQVPSAPTHVYRLCGKVTFLSAQGEVMSRTVDTSGTITGLDGRTLEAMTSGFARYYLADVTPGLPPALIRRDQGRGCSPAIS